MSKQKPAIRRIETDTLQVLAPAECDPKQVEAAAEQFAKTGSLLNTGLTGYRCKKSKYVLVLYPHNQEGGK